MRRFEVEGEEVEAILEQATERVESEIIAPQAGLRPANVNDLAALMEPC